jgi:hypothetical protein
MRLLFRPLGVWPRAKTTHPDRSPFTAQWPDTVKLLEREIDYVILKSKPEVLIQVDAPEGAMRLDGGIRADARANFHGVMISFESKFGPQSYLCDKYMAPAWANRGEQPWKDNVRAIAFGLEALRKIDRYGISDTGQQYQGWKALGAGIPLGAATMTYDEAERILQRYWDGVGDDRNWESLYRRGAKNLHPDAGGDVAEFKRLTEARDLLLNGVGSPATSDRRS